MSDTESGENFENLKIQVDNEPEEYYEEGEEVEDEEMLCSEPEDVTPAPEPESEPPEEKESSELPSVPTFQFSFATPQPREYTNPFGLQGVGIIPSEKKLQERAARFGLESSEAPKRITAETLDLLYDSCAIPKVERDLRKQLDEMDPLKGDALRQRPNYRLNTLHCRGVDDMSTEDVFSYFSNYGALSIEWVNDTSCNVVWENGYGAARAMAYLSQGVVTDTAAARNKIDKENKDQKTTDLSNGDETEKAVDVVEMQEADVEMECEEGEIKDDADETEGSEVILLPDEKLFHPKDVPIAVPPGFVWRLGVPHEKAKAILFRFATIEDRKPPRAQTRSQYYRKYGNPNFQGMRGIISESRKRKILEEREKRKKFGRGGHAPLDRVGDYIPPSSTDKRNPWGALAANWNEEWARPGAEGPPAPPPSTHSPRSSVRDVDSDLNLSFTDSGSDSEDSDGVVEWESKNKRPRMRMYADDVETVTKVKKSHRRRREKRPRASNEDRTVPPVSSSSNLSADFDMAPRRSLRDSVEPRPRSRRYNHRPEDDFMTDLRRRLSQSAGRDDDISDTVTDRNCPEKESIRVTIDNTEDSWQHEEDSDDEEEVDEDSEQLARRRSTTRRWRRSGNGSHGGDDLREALRRKPAFEREEDEDSDEVVARPGVPDLREKLRKLREDRGRGAEADPGKAEEKGRDFSPLRIEIDNEEYYGILGSDSE